MWTLLTIVVLIVVWCALAYCINNTITKPREAKRKLLEAQRDLAAQKRRLLEEQAANKIEKYNKLIEETEILKAQADELKKYHTEKVLEIDKYVKEKCDSYSHMAVIMSDLLTSHYEESAKILETKRNPAKVEAQRIREFKQEAREILRQKKELQYKIEYLRKLFPNIDDVFDDGFNEKDVPVQLETVQNTDAVRFFLSPTEYLKLSTAERNQLALDRYIDNRKSRWQIGRDYEMYIGYIYESKGFYVQYTGIIKNLEDMGRDLIVENNEKVYIIQCKNWSQKKTIHEKHIFQLFGTVVEYNINHSKKAQGVFVTTTALSDMAEKVAKELCIHVSHVEAGEFPRIKCNIGKSGEKIYHLPFDQQYDNVVIDKEKGEFYAFTVKDAERKGFRRACKFFG